MVRRTTLSPDQAAITEDDSALPGVPSGVPADVTVKYKTNVADSQERGSRNSRRELEELAAQEAVNLEPPDELSAFCAEWINFVGYPLAITRLPDPPERRTYGNAYVRSCFNTERLGDIAFDPANLVATLQLVNHNSGGIFRVWLTDTNGNLIPGAMIQRVAVADPPPGQRPNLPGIAPVPIAAPVPQAQAKSETEKQMENLQRRLFEAAIDRALNPPPIPVATANAPALPPEDQATLFLLGKTDFLGSIFGKMTDLANQAANVHKDPTWKERAIEAALELATNNPTIADRVVGVVDRIFARVLPDPRLDTPTLQPQQPQQFQPQPGQPYPTATNPAQAGQQPLDTADPNDGVEDDDIMDIIDQLLTLLNSNEVLTVNHPLFQQLRKDFPVKFRLAIGMIATQSLDDITAWIKDAGGPLYISLLDGASGPFLRERLTELQRLIIAAKQKAPATPTETQSQPATQTESQDAS